jgi:uncharacterized protein (TIGR00369 family)
LTSEARAATPAVTSVTPAGPVVPMDGPVAPADAAAQPGAEGTFDLAAHRCFACGDLNAQGIRMVIHIEPDRSWSDLVLDSAFQGWEGIAHGGILATLLDEAMAWAIASREAFAMPARMSIDYRRPVSVATPLRVEGRVVEAKRRLIRAAATVVDPATGDVCARAEGVYLTIPESRQDELRSRYRFSGATDGPGGARRWRVRQSLPAVEPLAEAGVGTGVGAATSAGAGTTTDGDTEADTPDMVAGR